MKITRTIPPIRAGRFGADLPRGNRDARGTGHGRAVGSEIGSLPTAARRRVEFRLAFAPSDWREPDGSLIEHASAIRLKTVMNRTKAILISLIPAVLLVAPVRCFGKPGPVRFTRDEPGSTLWSKGQDRRDPSAVDDSLDRAIRRWNRRLNAPPASGGSGSAYGPTQLKLSPPRQTIGSVFLPRASQDLTQSWQFHWRTALEPRAPSSVS
jgi:hypothetical protein